ncbi:hypothetical protein OHB49_42555 (plasmid) [Streptomyces sp. NBC_01717]|uniref:hypothetical protein n=1 Tax=Streptomyces sp. NBC_01717 TaxID=2975918 RepID=UPI002E3362EC|nr:hypothetical protein [Streptomyces sp. NBC_01717]
MVNNINTLASGTACYLTSSGVAEAERFVRERDATRSRFRLATNRVELGTFMGAPYMHVLDGVDRDWQSSGAPPDTTHHAP